MAYEGPAATDRVLLFATCLVDQFYPEVGEATVHLLRAFGAQVDFPWGQTCCGLPHYNNGFPKEAKRLAERNLRLFDGESPVVVPSGSCAWMLKVVYPSLFEANPWVHEEAQRFSLRVRELSAYLTEASRAFPGGEPPPRLGPASSRQGLPSPSAKRTVTYHDSCHALRGLGIREAPRDLIASLPGLRLAELPRSEGCCGFGGSFAVKFDEVSTAILKEKLEAAARTGADLLATADCGCLMQLRGGAGKWRSLGLPSPPPRVVHLAELLWLRGEEDGR